MARFEIKEKEGNPFGYLRVIMEDTETGVQYLYVQSGYSGGLTPIIDRGGKPYIPKNGQKA